ncbi:MAG: hypothetical protein R2731_19535 [Nocardioides sp.]
MSTSQVGPARVGAALLAVRAALLGAVVLAIGVVSHTSADGLLPGPPALLGVLAATTALAATVVRAPSSTPRIVTLVVGGQALVHVALTALAGHRGDPAAPLRVPTPDWRTTLAETGGSGSFRDRMAAADPGALDGGAGAAGLDLGWVGHLVEHAGTVGPAMLLAHTAAAVTVALWLAAGESALWTLVALMAAVVHAVVLRLAGGHVLKTLRRGFVPRVGAHPGVRRSTGRPRSRFHLVPCRRGPPLLAA